MLLTRLYKIRSSGRVPALPFSRVRRNSLTHAAGVLLAAAIFTLDLAQPLGLAVGMLYVLVIVLGLWTTWLPYPIVASVVATVLVVIDLVIGWPPATPGFTFSNRTLMVLVFASTAALVLRFKRLERRSATDLQQLADLKHAIDEAAIVATTDVTGRILSVNDKFCDISGYTREELIGQDHRIINSGLHSKAFIRDLWRTIADGRVWRGEIRNRAKDGHYYWVDTTIVPLLNDRGKPYQYIAIRAEVTRRKLAEERLMQQASLARVGQLAAVVAHEVKNPLAGIKGALQILMSRRPTGDAEVPVMRDVISRVDALNELIGDLLLYARPRAPRLAAVDLRPLLAEAAEMLLRDPLAREVDIAIADGSVTVDADAELLRATILNLLINAAQAMNGRGRLALAVRLRGEEAEVCIRDSGPGIPEAMREQVFEPFVTTKARGGGLGLSIARRTAELHGGRLDASFPLEGGTVMTLTLPLHPVSGAD